MFVGPNKHFSIVIDEFDGKLVKAWHIEIGKACRSTAHFISRFYPAMYDELLSGMDSFK